MNIELTNIDDIKPYPHNPRKNDNTIDSLVESIRKYGWQQPIVVDNEGFIVVGHSRYAAAKKLNLVEVPVIWARDLTEKQSRAYRIMDNKSHDFTKWDIVELKFELEDLEDLDATGFSLKELDDILYPEAGLVGNDSKYNPEFHAIIECNSQEDLDMVKELLAQKGWQDCRTNIY